MKRLRVTYDDVDREFFGTDDFELIRTARKHDLYQMARVITYDLEELDDGDKCSKCEEVGVAMER